MDVLSANPAAYAIGGPVTWSDAGPAPIELARQTTATRVRDAAS
jgi:hypothetical protein